MKLSEMREILTRRDIQLTKSLGQNFLHDANQLQKIVEAAELSKADKVLEIGPGLGPLTELLLEKAGDVLAIEMDRRLVEVLQERFAPAQNLNLLHDDALDFLRREPRASFKIPADCFFPAPNVDSMCVVLQRRARPLLADGQRAAFVKIVKRAFSQRRKMMLKLLKQDWAVDKLASAFAELKISPQERAEKLSLEQFVALTEKLFSHG